MVVEFSDGGLDGGVFWLVNDVVKMGASKWVEEEIANVRDIGRGERMELDIVDSRSGGVTLRRHGKW